MRDEAKQSNRGSYREESLYSKNRIKHFLNIRAHEAIDVANNGKEIDNKNITQIFVPFFTTKKEVQISV